MNKTSIFNGVHRMKKRYWIACILLITTSCNTKSVDQTSTSTNQGNVVIVQPFGQFPKTTTIALSDFLKKYFQHVVIKPEIELPVSSFNRNRHRYRADSLISFLKQHTNESEVCIGLTNKDISTTKGTYLDWGVMGLGYCPGKACVVSTYRLNQNNACNQLKKVAIHELGHTAGLLHCSNQHCFMRDAEGHNPTDEETEFCKNCEQVLMKQGWTISKTLYENNFK